MKSWFCLFAIVVPLLSAAQTPVRSEPAKPNLSQWIEDTRSLRALMRSDPHRPIYHFVAPEGAAMPFDPNGAIYWKGKYHLGFLYQKKPASKVGDPAWTADSRNNGHVWGHVVSTDLLHWTQYPDMLDFKEGDKEMAIFSGNETISVKGIQSWTMAETNPY